jgi:hypothetical protein
MAKVAADALFMHCRPVHRGAEKGVLAWVLGAVR